jgi:predicted Rossmann-fold nucleotide-binding protein
LFEALTLIQTKDVNKPLPIVLHGNFYWDDVFNLEVLVEHGTISAGDLELFIKTDPVDGAFDYIACPLTDSAMRKPEGILWTS